MKKYFVFIVMFFLIGGMSVHAQLKFGLKAGVNLSNVNFDKDNLLVNLDSKNLTGFQVGPMVEGMLAIAGFDLALLYSQQGFKLSNPSLSSEAWEEYKVNTLLVPVNLKAKIALVPKLVKAYVAMGPSFSVNLSTVKEQVEAKSFGVGLNFGLGAEVLSHLQVGLNYQLGLTEDYSNFKLDLQTITGMKAKPRMWSVTAAYLF